MTINNKGALGFGAIPELNSLGYPTGGISPDYGTDDDVLVTSSFLINNISIDGQQKQIQITR